MKLSFFVSAVILYLSSVGLAVATETTYQSKDPQKQKLFLELKEELRCPMCQNQTIGDSNAMIALDLKRKTFDLVESGKSKQEVIDYMKARYGEFVHYQPPVTPITIWLWLLPVGFVVVAFSFMFFGKRRREASIEHDGAVGVNTHSVASKDLKKADKLLDKYK